MQQQQEGDKQFISLYDDPTPDKRTIGIEVERLQKAFPQIDKNYLFVLTERIIDKKITAQQLKDAVNRVIDTCVYPVPGMAEILSFDKRIKLYTYIQALRLKDEGIEFSRQFDMIDIDGKIMYFER